MSNLFLQLHFFVSVQHLLLHPTGWIAQNNFLTWLCSSPGKNFECTFKKTDSEKGTDCRLFCRPQPIRIRNSSVKRFSRNSCGLLVIDLHSFSFTFVRNSTSSGIRNGLTRCEHSHRSSTTPTSSGAYFGPPRRMGL